MGGRLYGSNGWLIEGGADDDDSAKMNAAEADSLYRLLELEVVPTFYDRDKSGVPKGWLRIVKEAIRTVMPHFNSPPDVEAVCRGNVRIRGTPSGSRLALAENN